LARTDLLHRFQRLYRDFSFADAHQISVAEVQVARLRRRASRRDFLKTIGGAVAAGALFTRPQRASGAASPRIAIVGAGIAGLTAALALSEAGYASTVYEASSRIGGRMHSDTTTWANGQITEHCGELIETSHQTILALAKRFQIPIIDLAAAEPPRATETYHLFGRYYRPEQANRDFYFVYQAVRKDLNAAGYPTLYNRSTPAASTLDHISVYEWIESHVPGGHRSNMGQLLDLAYNLEFGGETRVQSALNLVYSLSSESLAVNFKLFRQTDERYRLQGGNERLPRAIASALPPGSIRTNISLTGIARNKDGTFTLSFKPGSSKLGNQESGLSKPDSSGSTVIADRVILAIPFSILRNLDYRNAGFNPVKVLGIRELGYGNNAKLHLQFETRMWNQSGPWGRSTGASFADTGYQNTWDATRAQNGKTGILVNFTGGSVGASFIGDPTDKRVVRPYARQFLNNLEPVFPGITKHWNGRATLDVPARNPYSLGSYAFYKVGQCTQFGGSEGERSGNCHFAGEHCSIEFQGYMEGGAAEGLRAANEILADYKAGISP
jgi:monoamine oxidase